MSIVLFTAFSEPCSNPHKRQHRLWRNAVEYEAKRHKPNKPLKGPVSVFIRFKFQRPPQHFDKSGKLQVADPFLKENITVLSQQVLEVLSRNRFWTRDKQIVDLYVERSCLDQKGLQSSTDIQVEEVNP